MANLNTSYMGIPISSPFVVAASSISNMVERIQRAEEAGAGALVIRSLFEEQIHAEQAAADNDGLQIAPDDHLEAARVYFPALESDAARSHLMWVKKACEAVQMPLIASLAATTAGAWTTYAVELARTGVKALELNIYHVAADPYKSGVEIENELFEIIDNIAAVVNIPIAVKLSPFYTSLAHVAWQLDKRGVAGLVLFNRFLQPNINADDLTLYQEHLLSRADEMKLPLRWVAILHGRVKADLALTTGVHSATDAAKAILGGAQVVQVASVLYEQGLEHLTKLNDDLKRWMEHKNYADLAAFRGKLSQQTCADPATFERAHYVKMMLDEN